MNMESFPPWKAKAVCSVCGSVLDRFPLFHCPQKHPCCHRCFKLVNGGDSHLTCPLCRITRGPPMEPHPLHHQESGRRLKNKPGIGRPYRYNVNPLPVTTYNYSKNYQDFSTASISPTNNIEDEEKIFEALIGMTKEQFYSSQTIYKKEELNFGRNEVNRRLSSVQDKKARSHLPKSKFSLPPLTSKRPFRCPHRPCHKTVALAQFVNHFKSEHRDVQSCTVERGKELLLPCDVSLIEYNYHLCLAMITVYEINRIDYLKSGSSESVVRTCNKFCQKVPISSFWLMISGPPDRHVSSAYCWVWLFTNSEDPYKCTIELGSKEDSVTLSTFCGVYNALDQDFANVKTKLQCLIVTKSSLRSILKEGAVLNLRVIVH